MRNKAFVICNEFDRPYVGLVAWIENEPKYRETADAVFITTGTSMTKLEIAKYRMTYIEDFGVELEFSDGTVTARKVRPSVAKYPNGELREWQGPDVETLPLKPQFAALFSSAEKHVATEAAGK